MPKVPGWLLFLAFLFVLFLIYTDPTNASSVASGFGDFVVRLLQGLGDFLTGLFGEETTTLESPAPAESAPTTSVVDSYSHTHDGIPAHSHPATDQ